MKEKALDPDKLSVYAQFTIFDTLHLEQGCLFILVQG